VQDFGTADIAMVLSLGAPLNAVPKAGDYTGPLSSST